MSESEPTASLKTRRRLLPRLARALSCVAILAPATAGEDGDKPSPTAIAIRLNRPDAQLDRFLKLFEGARFPHPASAFAAWKRATVLDRDEPRPFSKAAEALIAFLNPEMVPELKTLDGAQASARWEKGTGKPIWSVTIPGDDGTFAALATALSLTDGSEIAPIGNARADRLGPKEKDSPILAQKGRLVVIASTRDEAALALKRLENAGDPDEADRGNPPSGFVADFDPRGFADCPNLTARRIFASLSALDVRRLSATAACEGDDLTLSVVSRFSSGRASSQAAIQADWLDYAPKNRTVAVVAAAIDPKPETWNALFSAIDRGLRADPAQAKLADARARLGILTWPTGSDLEADLFPKVVGLTCIVIGRFGRRSPDGFVAAIHCDSIASALRLTTETFPRLARGWSSRKADRDHNPEPDAGRILGELSGRAIAIARLDRTVLLSWGDPRSTLTACLDARTHLERSNGPLLRRIGKLDGPAPLGFGAFWPGLLSEIAGGSARLSTALATAPPIVWSGSILGEADGKDVRPTRTRTRLDSFRWTGARETIRRFLDDLPIAKP